MNGGGDDHGHGDVHVRVALREPQGPHCAHAHVPPRSLSLSKGRVHDGVHVHDDVRGG